MDFRLAALATAIGLGLATPALAMKSAAPDAGGYIYIDNHENGGPAYDFQDISGSGTYFNLTDDSTFDIALPFNFTFYGTEYASVRVSSNGFINFGETTGSACCSGLEIPLDDATNNIVAAWWEDLNPNCAGAEQHWQVVGSAPKRVFIIQHTNTPSYTCDPGDNTFEYKLFEEDHSIEVHYQSLTSGDSGTFTIGIENSGGTTGHQVYYGSGLTPPLHRRLGDPLQQSG